MPPKLPRILVVDACILFSFFKRDSVRRHIIERLSNLGCRLIAPEFVFEELVGDEEKIKKFAGINELGFLFLFSLLEKKIETFSEEEYKEFLSEAKKLSPHEQTPKDDPYFALALSFNSAIWSDEIDFKQQSSIKIFSTSELDKILFKTK